MKEIKNIIVVIFAMALAACNSVADSAPEATKERKTEVTIAGNQFHINGAPSYTDRVWTTAQGESFPIEGLLMNSRMVQGIFDDLNPKTKGQWAYPDTKQWDPDRNTHEFIEAMPLWREYGLLSFTINLQGGCPYGYCRTQPWDNSAFESDGTLREDFMKRLELILDRADELGMIPIIGFYYFGQDERLVDETSIKAATANATEWILEKGYNNVIVELSNECDVQAYDHDILKCERIDELITLAKSIEIDGRTLYVGTSHKGNTVPLPSIVEASDFVLLHGNGVQKPERMKEMIDMVRAMDVYKNTPIVTNEDDRPWRQEDQGWGDYGNNMAAAVQNYASWGFFDFRLEEENSQFNKGYQSVPINWQISSERKQSFFGKLAEITGYPGAPRLGMQWSDEPGKVMVIVQAEEDHSQITEISLLVNNEVMQTLTKAPYEFELSTMPEHWHQVKARAKYPSDDELIVIETPLFENPWWNYGGAKQQPFVGMVEGDD